MGLVGNIWGGFKKYTPTGKVLGYLLDPQHGDSSALTDAQKDAKARADALNHERQSYAGPAAPMVNGVSAEPPPGPTYTQPPPTTDTSEIGVPGFGVKKTVTHTPAPVAGPPAPNYIDDTRQRQNQALDLLLGAAQGNTPSQAEIASKAAADRAASQQFGIAAALQGSLSPGATLRQASEGSASILGNNANDLAANRAKEMSDARNQLVSGLGGLRTQENTLGLGQAQMNLDAQLANQRAILAQRGLDNQQINALLAAYVQTLGLSVEQARAIVDANFKNAAADNAGGAALVNGVTGYVTGKR